MPNERNKPSGQAGLQLCLQFALYIRVCNKSSSLSNNYHTRHAPSCTVLSDKKRKKKKKKANSIWNKLLHNKYPKYSIVGNNRKKIAMTSFYFIKSQKMAAFFMVKKRQSH